MSVERINTLYEAFSRMDGEAMAACYHPEATFSDPVFQGLKGKECGAMWRMLTGRSKDLRIEFRDVRSDGQTGAAHWEAWYSFQGNPVHNVIDARFTFMDGLILTHEDSFDLVRWCGMGLGTVGKLFGWFPGLHWAIRRKVKGDLAAWMARH
jgi:hypothetical protein